MVNDPFSTFKRHSAWFTERSGPSPHQPHTPSIDAYWRRRAQPPDPRLPRWECLGPFNTAGRVTSLAVHPSQPDRLWAGAAAGGVWTSSDAGANWQSCWPVWACPNIGALALDAARPNHIFCATGEANLSPDCYPGTGLYHSRDAGRSWNMLASAEAQGLPPRIGVLVPSRLSPGVLYLGGGTLDDQHPAGLYSSSNGGRSWVRHNQPSPSNYWCHSLVEHPGGFLLAALGLGGAQSGIWRGEPGGGAWHRVQAGLPSGDHTGRIGLALSPSHPDTVYALVGDRAGNKVLGIFRSRDGGRRWHETGGTHFRSEAQSCYNSAIAVHPLDPDVVMCGLNDLHLSRDGGATWQRVTRWDASDGNPRAVHADQHAIVFAGGDRIYSATDGGVATSGDLGRSWHMCPRAMVNTMFYDIDVAPANASILGGGAQDNGTLMAGVSGEPGDFLHVLDGDGAWIVFHPGPESLVTGSRSDIHIYRHSPAHGWDPESWKEISPKRMSDDEHHQNAIAVLAVHPTDPLTIWAGSRRLWRTTNAGRSWRPVSHEFDGSAITAIEIPPAAPLHVWAGTRNGGLFRSLDGGASWSGDLSGPQIPARVVTRIESHPRKASRLIVTSGGAGLVSRSTSRARRYSVTHAASQIAAYPHIFLSEDNGVFWRPIDSPHMPNSACHAAIFETHKPYRLFVASDFGVWMTLDLSRWTDVSTTLPNVMISDLVYHHGSRSLTAATYGRGIWRAFL